SDRALSRKVDNTLVFQFPAHSCRAVEETFLVQPLTRTQQQPLHSGTTTRGTVLWPTRVRKKPLRLLELGAVQPLAKPSISAPQRRRDSTDAFSSSNASYGTFTLFLKAPSHPLLRVSGRRQECSVMSKSNNFSTWNDVLSSADRNDVLSSISSPLTAARGYSMLRR